MIAAVPAAAAAATYEATISACAMELSGSDGAPGSQWHHDARGTPRCKDEEEETECTASTSGACERYELASSDVECMDLASTSGACERFELASSDMECMDLGSVNTTSLLPVTTGSSRTAKRRFRRQRTRQKHRMLQQFPELAGQELQVW